MSIKRETKINWENGPKMECLAAMIRINCFLSQDEWICHTMMPSEKDRRGYTLCYVIYTITETVINDDRR